MTVTTMSTRLLLICVAVTAFGACRHERVVENPPLPVTVAQVGGSGRSGGARYSASLEPDVEVAAAFKVGGYVEWVAPIRGADGRMRNLQDGDRVTRGTVLARIRDREYRDAVTQAEAALVKSKADFTRTAQLFENRSVAKADYDAAYARYRADEAAHDRSVQSLNDCTLVAPLDGFVLKRSIEVGTLVSPGSPAFDVGDTRRVKVVFGVPDVLVGSLKAGTAQSVSIEAVPGTLFQGRFTRVAPSADAASRMFEAEVTLANPNGVLKPGMIAGLEVAPGSAKVSSPGALIPLNAVVRPPGSAAGFAVYVVDHSDKGDVARLRMVELGDISGSQIQVTKGLDGGERVIVRGATLAVDAGAVRVIPE